MTHIAAHGIEVEVPPGWDGRIARRRGDGAAEIGAEFPVVHLANFPLPQERGDFGSGAVERMRPPDVLLCVIEFDRADGALFRRVGIPRFRARDFSPNAMQRTVAGMCGAQAFFTVSGRGFCAYAVLGSFRSRSSLVPPVNEALAGLSIASG
ncbi:MAG: hypothetical protein ACT452_14160 [Microthrixaceae bacterium]